MKGIELICEERKEQVEKHKWDINNKEFYSKGELFQVSNFALMSYYISVYGKCQFKTEYPKNWDIKWKDKIINKSALHKLAVAGALCLAEYDRTHNLFYIERCNYISGLIDKLK